MAKKLLGDKEGPGSYLRESMRNWQSAVRSLKHALGKGIEVTRTSKNNDINKRLRVRDHSKKRKRSSWVAKFDEW